MSVQEVEAPLCIASGSLDRKIMLYSIKEGCRIRVIQAAHELGVRRMTYSSVNGGYLVSTGFDVNAKVWSPESVVGDILIGKLKGHTRPIIDSKFIGISPFIVSIDEIIEVRIWDIKSFSCMQVVKAKLYTKV